MDVSNKPYTPGNLDVYTAHSAIEATATSGSIDVSGAKKIMIVLTGAGTWSNRSGVLTITTSVDGSTFDNYSMLLTNTATASTATLTRVATVTMAAAGTDSVWMSPETIGAMNYIKAKLTITDTTTPTGNFTLKIAVQR